MRKFISLLAAILFSAACAIPAHAQQKQDLRWGAGSQGSINAEAALATSQVLRLAGLPVYSVNTSGTVDGLLTLSQGELDLVSADNRSLLSAWNGSDGFQKIDNFQQVMSGFTTFFFIMVPDGSPIKTMEDLKGRSVNGHVPGSAINFWARDFVRSLESIGLVGKGNVKLSQIALSDVFDALQDGRIDAQVGYVFSDRLPTWIQQGMTRGIKLRIIPMPVELLDPLGKSNWLSVENYPAKEVAKVDQSIDSEGTLVTSGLTTIVIARDKLPADLIEQFLDIFYSEVDKIAAAHTANSVYQGGPYTGAAYLLPEIEVHPGAAAFYKKHGAWRDEFGVRSGS